MKSIHNFKFSDWKDSEKFLFIESDKIYETIEFIKENNIRNIYVSRFRGYELDNIEPLLSLKGIKRFQYQEYGKKISLKGIENFNELKFLRIDDIQPIDLSAFPKLETLILKWSNKILNLDTCSNLKKLNLWNFNTKEKDFSRFPLLKSLKTLNLFYGNAISFDGLRLSEIIEKLYIYSYPKLKSIQKLNNYESLKKIEFESCKRISDIDSLRNLNNLEKLKLYNCGEIENINFIMNMPKLNDFYFIGTNVLDGNLELMEKQEILKVNFETKKHYTHTLKNKKVVRK